MNKELFSDINFEFANDEIVEYIKSLSLKSMCGENLFFIPLIDHMFIVCDSLNDIFFIDVYINDRDTDKKYNEQLFEKYKNSVPVLQYYHAVGLREYILLINKKIIRVFTHESRYADGISIRLLEIITSDFKDEDIPFIKNIISNAIRFKHPGVPEYSYTDADLKVTISGFKLFK